MLDPFIFLLVNIISLINLALFVWVIIGLLLQFDIINRNNGFVMRIYDSLTRLFTPLLQPIRNFLGRILPDLGGLDLSPIVLILLLMFLKDILYSWFL